MRSQGFWIGVGCLAWASAASASEPVELQLGGESCALYVEPAGIDLECPESDTMWVCGPTVSGDFAPTEGYERAVACSPDMGGRAQLFVVDAADALLWTGSPVAIDGTVALSSLALAPSGGADGPRGDGLVWQASAVDTGDPGRTTPAAMEVGVLQWAGDGFVSVFSRTLRCEPARCAAVTVTPATATDPATIEVRPLSGDPARMRWDPATGRFQPM